MSSHRPLVQIPPWGTMTTGDPPISPCTYLPLVQIPPWGTMTYDDWRSTDISVYFFRSIACCIPVAVCSLISSYVAIAA